MKGSVTLEESHAFVLSYVKDKFIEVKDLW